MNLITFIIWKIPVDEFYGMISLFSINLLLHWRIIISVIELLKKRRLDFIVSVLNS